jgi:lipooligosaccharide transport system permease protein
VSTALAFRRRSLAGVWLRHAVVLLRTWRVAITWFFVEPVFVLVAIGFGIGRMVGDEKVDGALGYALFVTPGVIIGTAMFHSIFECAWSAFQRVQQGLYETMLTTPLTLPELVCGEILWGTTRAAISTFAVGGFALVIGWLPLGAAPGVLAAALLVGILFAEIGLLFAALAPTMSALSLVFTLVATPLYFFCGAFFPIAVLPAWLQPVAWAAPLTSAVHLARGFTEGGLGTTHVWATLYLVVLIAVLYPLVELLLRRRLIK